MSQTKINTKEGMVLSIMIRAKFHYVSENMNKDHPMMEFVKELCNVINTSDEVISIEDKRIINENLDFFVKVVCEEDLQKNIMSASMPIWFYKATRSYRGGFLWKFCFCHPELVEGYIKIPFKKFYKK